MLKERVTELMNRYESGEEIMTGWDLCEELDSIIQDEPWDEGLSYELCLCMELFNANARQNGHSDRDLLVSEVERLIDFGK